MYVKSLRENFEALGFPADASDFLIDLWNAVQVFDDAADGDEIKRHELDAAIWSSLAGIQLNAFYAQNQVMLLPVISLSIVKWQASDEVERSGKADAKSYMWRAGYYDVVCMVNLLVNGSSTENALNALNLYGETFEDYMKEFPNA